MFTKSPVHRLWFALLAALGLIAPLAAEPVKDADIVVITLLPEVNVSDSNVSLADVARLSGGDARLRQRIADLDVAEVDPSGHELSVSKRQVTFRINLAGLDAKRFRVEGANTVVIRPSRTAIGETEALAAVRQLLAGKLSCDPSMLVIRLAHRANGPWYVGANARDLQLEAALQTGSRTLGAVKADLLVYSKGAKITTLPLDLEVKLLQTRAFTLTPVDAGERFTPENLRVERQEVDQPTNLSSAVLEPFAQKAKHKLSSGRTLSMFDVEPAVEDNPVLVKRNEMVKMLAQVGSLSISTVGEALQDGRAGQLIRVRNSDSKAIVAGKVIGRSTILVGE